MRDERKNENKKKEKTHVHNKNNAPITTFGPESFDLAKISEKKETVDSEEGG